MESMKMQSLKFVALDEEDLAIISTHPDFAQEFEAAKAELRAALGM